ncbi:hypothetical protein DJ71_09250 [Halorubrum sp. E3]|uniref:hypothetical protein n=1 Tax=Halorubrum sp. GN12_10-3_MGM TaxID=2518113 RepID=UPI0002B78DD5|nr:hypothetical protein [Halorubrum sp. GN12_10-3_MGM]AGF91284.1 hypothetical protein HAPG_00099 [Halorubrum phage GNf2]OYR79443.1 hypothetical protein DJ72_14095 [Halorubrum distributum]OYR84226.1 hypothetical protein DJ71_09250 [Halorubrum sp. E3]TKX64191.1 hypothetical protein EXE47_12485 [Halorubrum sp. GN12_10-3_MGM]
MDLTDILTQPVAVATAAGGALLQLLGVTWLDPFVSVVLANIGTLFTALSISGFTIAPEVAWLPEDTLTTLTLVAAGVYVLKLLDSFADQLKQRLDNDDN